MYTILKGDYHEYRFAKEGFIQFHSNIRIERCLQVADPNYLCLAFAGVRFMRIPMQFEANEIVMHPPDVIKHLVDPVPVIDWENYSELVYELKGRSESYIIVATACQFFI